VPAPLYGAAAAAAAGAALHRQVDDLTLKIRHDAIVENIVLNLGAKFNEMKKP